MDDADQWRLWRGSRICASRLSLSAVRLEVVLDKLKLLQWDGSRVSEGEVVGIQKVLTQLYDGVRQSRELLPLLERYAQNTFARQGEPSSPDSVLGTPSNCTARTAVCQRVVRTSSWSPI
jgi:hypothetical protein